MHSWLEIPKDTDFSIYNLPFGIFSIDNSEKKVGVAIGDYIIDLSAAARLLLFEDLIRDVTVFQREFLNDFISLGKDVTVKVRDRIQKELCRENSILKNEHVLVSRLDATMHLPVFVRDYTDFYSSIEHATNVGIMFRDPENALLPNWRHLPVGYHGRASSIVVSGTDIIRPKGQTKPADGPPVFGPSQRLDFELEMAFVVGKESLLGNPIPVEQTEDYIFGMVLFNDWSARDIQSWEYVPLGPFLGKNFGSSVSPWVVTMEALNPLRVEGPIQDPPVLHYLASRGKNNYDIHLSVALAPQDGNETTICRSNFKYMYWNMRQQLAHHTVNGCNVNIGDMMASGTISGKEPSSFGSMLELSWAGKNPLTLNDGSQRKFLNDYDTVIIRGYGEYDEKRIGFGEVRGKIIP